MRPRGNARPFRATAGPRSAAKMSISRTGAERFVPQVAAGMRLLGVVQRGMQVGALVQLDDGTYAQVNGDVVQPLNTSRVEAALRASPSMAPPSRPVAAPAAPASVPTVIVKRRRLIAPP